MAPIRRRRMIADASREALTENVRAYALGLEADLVGIAAVDRFEGAPTGHHPQDWLPECRSVIVLGLRQLEATLDWPRMMLGTTVVRPEHRLEVLQDYWYTIVNHDVHDAVLDQMALRLALYLQRRGYASLFHEASFPPTLNQYLASRLAPEAGPRHGLFSHRHAAVRAGLGEFGLNNLVITPEYGPYVRFVSVLTEADLVPSELLQKKACLGRKCSLCLDLCGGEVLTLRPEAERAEVWLNPVSRTDRARCAQRRSGDPCLGQCVAQCPVGLPLRTTRKRAHGQRRPDGGPTASPAAASTDQP